MIRLLISPSSFEILPFQTGQNPYLHHQPINPTKAHSQHSRLVNALSAVLCPLPKLPYPLPDIVFMANSGLSLPRLRAPLILLPRMKFLHRQQELPLLKQLFHRLGVPTMDYPGVEPFEGQAELQWFDGGRKAVCGYGFRSTKQTCAELDRLFTTLYGKEKPKLLCLKLASAEFYHLDVAMLQYDNQCIVHRRAFSDTSLRKLERFLGKQNVTVLETPDRFCLNAIVDGARLITHKLTDPLLKPWLHRLTSRTVHEIDATEFEKSGGSVRCLVLDVHL
jgi:N-dimethylarginine dimethylaminohydrolase